MKSNKLKMILFVECVLIISKNFPFAILLEINKQEVNETLNRKFGKKCLFYYLIESESDKLNSIITHQNKNCENFLDIRL